MRTAMPIPRLTSPMATKAGNAAPTGMEAALQTKGTTNTVIPQTWLPPQKNADKEPCIDSSTCSSGWSLHARSKSPSRSMSDLNDHASFTVPTAPQLPISQGPAYVTTPLPQTAEAPQHLWT